MSCARRNNPAAFPGFVEPVARVAILVSLLLLMGGCSLPTQEDPGVLYGSKVRVDFGSGGLNGDPFSTTTDEAGLFFSGNFGRFEMGREDRPEERSR
jgi:hypothetical protein